MTSNPRTYWWPRSGEIELDPARKFPEGDEIEPVEGFAFDPRKERLAATSVDGTLQVWNTRSGKTIHLNRGRRRVTGLQP